MIAAELGLPHAEVRLEIGGSGRGAQIGETTYQLDHHFGLDCPRAVVVQGDTNSTLGAALAANARGIPLVHVEAGLRCFDRTLPEEHNRVLTDHLADLCCAPTDTNRANLASEGIVGARVVVTGNTVVEAVIRMLPDADDRRAQVRRWGLTPNGFVVATLHREANVDQRENLECLLVQLGSLPLPVVLPIHPRTEDRVHRFGLSSLLAPLQIRSPLGYREFLILASECALLVTDSGGIQEEASLLKKPALVIRTSTERPEVEGTFATLVTPGPAIGEVARSWLKDLTTVHRRLAELPTPYGDGTAAEQTIAAMAALLARRSGGEALRTPVA